MYWYALVVETLQDACLSTLAQVKCRLTATLTCRKRAKHLAFRMRDVPVSANDRVFYSDFAPLNIASLNSLNLLRDEMKYEMSDDDVGGATNHGSTQSATTHLPSKHPITCFRPNIVVLIGDKNTSNDALTNAFGEETWQYFQIGENAKFRYLKRCPRCTVPSRNPTTGDWLYKKNKRLPQKTLKKMFPAKAIDKEWEEQWQGATFGVHIGWDSEGEDSTVIEVGDHVQCYTFHNLPGKNWGRIFSAFMLTLGVAFMIFLAILKISHHTNTIETMNYEL